MNKSEYQIHIVNHVDFIFTGVSLWFEYLYFISTSTSLLMDGLLDNSKDFLVVNNQCLIIK